MRLVLPLSDEGLAQIPHLFAPQHPLVPVVLLLLSPLVLLELFLDLLALQVVSALLLEALMVEVELFPDELASEGVQLDVGLELLGLDVVPDCQDPVDGVLPVLLVQPLVLRYFVVVQLLVKDIILGC